ncbi:hypothetical protein [Streptomyces sp. YIM S03343]
MLYIAVFVVGCVTALTGCVALVSGWVPPWLDHVARPRLFGLWGLCMGVFCMVQLPVLRDRVVGMGPVAIDAVPLLAVVGMVALLLGKRPGRARRLFDALDRRSDNGGRRPAAG